MKKQLLLLCVLIGIFSSSYAKMQSDIGWLQQKIWAGPKKNKSTLEHRTIGEDRPIRMYVVDRRPFCKENDTNYEETYCYNSEGRLQRKNTRIPRINWTYSDKEEYRYYDEGNTRVTDKYATRDGNSYYLEESDSVVFEKGSNIIKYSAHYSYRGGVKELSSAHKRETVYERGVLVKKEIKRYDCETDSWIGAEKMEATLKSDGSYDVVTLFQWDEEKESYVIGGRLLEYRGYKGDFEQPTHYKAEIQREDGTWQLWILFDATFNSLGQVEMREAEAQLDFEFDGDSWKVGYKYDREGNTILYKIWKYNELGWWVDFVSEDKYKYDTKGRVASSLYVLYIEQDKGWHALGESFFEYAKEKRLVAASNGNDAAADDYASPLASEGKVYVATRPGEASTALLMGMDGSLYPRSVRGGVVDVSMLPKGIYMVRMENGLYGIEALSKVVVQ